MATNEVVTGVWLTRAGEALERSALPMITLSVIASWDGTEVIRQEVREGTRFGLRPEAGWNALEVLYILQGEAVWEDGRSTLVLGPGDSLRGNPVQEPCILQARTDLVALYVCSQPVFHQLSDDLGHLREMAVAVELKDGHTADHCDRVQTLSVRTGQHLGLSPTRLHYLLYGAYLHDLGKVKVPDGILLKPGKLTDAEWAVIRRHPTFGREMLQNTFLAGAGFILEQHHERLDGSGYPFGLKGDEVSVEAQIVAVADSYDAITSNRVYQKARDPQEAIAELKAGAGRLFRADVVDAFILALSESEPT